MLYTCMIVETIPERHECVRGKTDLRNKKKGAEGNRGILVVLMPNTHRGNLFLSCCDTVHVCPKPEWYHQWKRRGCSLTHLHLQDCFYQQDIRPLHHHSQFNVASTTRQTPVIDYNFGLNSLFSQHIPGAPRREDGCVRKPINHQHRLLVAC